MTNDGALAQKLMKAGSHVPKTYWVKVSGKPEEKAIAKLRAGITIALEDGRRVKTSPAKIRLAQDGAKESGSSASLGTNEWPLEARGKQVASGERANPWYEVTLIEGRNRQIKVTSRSEEHSLNSSHVEISYAVFCLKKKKKKNNTRV